MRRLFRWAVGVASALAVWRIWSRRHRDRPPADPDPADELRRRLAETRDDEHGDEAPPSDGSPTESLDERRARVHSQAQETIEAMHEDEA